MKILKGTFSAKILAVTIFVVLVIQAFFGILQYRTIKVKEYNHLDSSISSLVEDTLLTISDPVYNFDDKRVREIADFRLADRYNGLEAILIFQTEDNHESLFVGRVLGAENAVSDLTIQPSGSFYSTIKSDILKEGEKIGRVEFYFSDARAREAVEEALRQIIVALFVLETVLVAAIYTAMKRIVTHPILLTTRKVEEAASAISDRQGPANSADIVLALKANEDELGQLNRAMEKLFHARTKELRRSEEWFRALIENLNEMVIVVAPNGDFRYISPTVEKILGYQPDELHAARFDIIHPDDIAAIDQLTEKALHNPGTPHGREFRFRHRDGNILTFAAVASGYPDNQAIGGVVFNFYDITEIMEAQKAVQESESRFRQLADAGFEGIVIHEAGVILDTNHQMIQLLDYGRDEVIGKNIFSFVSPESKGTAMKTYADRSEKMIEVNLVKKDGTAIFVESRARSIDYAGKDVRIVIVRDVSARKAAEEKLRVAKEEAESATVLKDKFVSLVSHDLRSPIGGIHSMLKILQQDDKYKLDETKRKEILNKTMDNAKGLLNLIDKLLDLSRLKTGKIILSKRFLSAYHVAELHINALAYNAEAKGIAIRNEIPRAMRLFADDTLYGEVLHNLIGNAIKFSNKGDTVTLFVPPQKTGTIAVRDTGVGMPPETLERIFKGEIRTSIPGTGGEKGTGLGLQYCREIMTAHGGILEGESQNGKGSVFYAVLPVVRAVALLVDDMEVQREVIKDMLSDISGLDFLEAENGQDALAVMRRTLPHLVVTDLNMPVMDGFKLIEEVKRNPLFNGIPVIAVTSVTSSGGDAKEVDIRNRVFALGANDFVTKPFTKGEFMPRVQRYLGYS
ncbi:MAG: PAS domain S-box protein [Nitrospinota bacterium]|nr:PAS domain S-box protein [Nitrospinota bacterium]